jgi:hypothetical protein
MASLIRTLLIWLLVLAVPAQAAAAATMAFCGPSHDGGRQATVSRQGAPTGHAHHGSAAESPHEHRGVAAQPDEDASASPASTTAPAKLVQADKCSACTSCCSAAAILTTVLTVPAPAISPTVSIADVPTVDACAAEGPDRPPRVFLA